MTAGLVTLVEAFRGLDVVVVGEAMLDSYLEGSSHRLCQEAPVPVVALDARADSPGGAANTAANAAALGADVRLLSVVGDDPEATLLETALSERGVATELVVEPGRRTHAKHRVVASGQILVRFDQGTSAPLPARPERALVERLRAAWADADVVIASDYGHGLFTPGVIAAVAALQASQPRVLVVDARDLRRWRGAGATAVKPNAAEVAGLLSQRLPADARGRAEAIAREGERILGACGARIAAVTLDRDGSLVLERDGLAYRTYARPAANARVTGAGDSYVAALGLALGAGGDMPAAAELASAAAQAVVEKPRTATCSAAELRAAVTGGGKVALDWDELAGRLEGERQHRRRIVFTNGCFDILHRGHITYLNRAKALGDVLVVGVNSDESIRRLKGPERPINPLDDRLQVLAALSSVDFIVPFGEDTPSELVAVVRPDVFAKGGDYTRATLPEAPLVEALGGVVRILPFLPDRSTTGVIERIRQADSGIRQADSG